MADDSEPAVWLFEQGSRLAHLFPADDDQTRAACGFILEEECDNCGHSLDVRNARNTDTRCSSCLAHEVTEDDADPSGGVA